jgi:hypothetical protein
MTVGKAAALTAGFVGAVALGIAIGPSVTEKLPHRGAQASAQQPTSVVAEKASPAVATHTRASVSRADGTRTAQTATRKVAIAVSEPKLHERLKPVLREGTRMEIAAEGFRNAEDFATVAHAARNTNVPFMVLKDRVVTHGRTLAQAIHELKPQIDARAEVIRARTAAKTDLAAVAG